LLKLLKIVTLVAIAVSGLMLASQVICGLWLRYSGQAVDESGIRFHVMLGLATAVVVAVTLVLSWVSVVQR